jgi:hypothetical protein
MIYMTMKHFPLRPPPAGDKPMDFSLFPLPSGHLSIHNYVNENIQVW